MNKKDAKAIAAQKLEQMPGETLDSILSLLWGKDLSMYAQSDTDKLKLIGKAVRTLQRELATSRAGLRSAHKETERLRSVKLFV